MYKNAYCAMRRIIDILITHKNDLLKVILAFLFSHAGEEIQKWKIRLSH